MFSIQSFKPATPALRNADGAPARRQQGPQFQGMPRYQPDVFDISGCQLAPDKTPDAARPKSRFNILA